MKIRAQTNVLLMVAALMALLAIAATIVSVRELAHKRADIEAAENLIASVGQLRMIAVETVLFHDARATDQWRRKLASIGIELERLRFDTVNERINLDRISKNLVLAQSVYERLSPTQLAVEPANAANAALEARTVASLFVVTQEILDSGYELIQSGREQSQRAFNLLQITVGAVIFGATALLAVLWRLVSGRVLKPLGEVQSGTRRIGSGELSYRLNLKQRDEIGDLAAEFDTMSDRLQQTQSELAREATASRLAESAQQELASHTQAILDNVVDGIITIDADGIVRSFNLAAEEIFGYAALDVVGCKVNLLVPEPADGGQGSEPSSDCDIYATRFIGTVREVMGRRKNGEPFPIDFGVSRSIQQGQPLFIGVVRDITERKRIDQMKSEFVSTVSHELRTPLTSISGSLGLIVGGALGELPAMMKPMIAIAHKNSLRLSHLINDLLDMEKLVAGKIHFDFKVQPLMPLVEQCLESAQAYAEQYKVSFVIDERVDAAQVKVDGMRLQQVLANFLSNAAKYSPAGDKVSIKVSQRDELVRVEVSDRGLGIPEEFRSRIFQKFSQADSSDTREKSGTGLGLAISKELIERMQGRVGFVSEPGQGTTFWFELPIAGAEAKPL